MSIDMALLMMSSGVSASRSALIRRPMPGNSASTCRSSNNSEPGVMSSALPSFLRGLPPMLQLKL
eukprot:CAMPEP_0177400272 /NCGR_PEP_ID=MMETSP0368-20130122/58994_1 /TAXON_ID=447022 ORGANISM="Scrippsiella hangoei-like, Strain SHHI-4" /NCGR_SAMPLE_ID=MMETSP0368 /ASSEMBLY_ACC=CAM_ASM_000363 /LENGTH=64 /DNA_ID=CAMNT_0018867707 /DNA_START=114 /DNA_END=308 /DNA_ORIENTATION=-